MTIRRILAEDAIGGFTFGTVAWPGMPVSSMISFACHVAFLSGGGTLSPRPGDDAVVRQVREFADQLEILGLKRTVGAQKSPCFQALSGFPSSFAAGRTGFRVFIGLFEHGSPKLSFCCGHGTSRC
jgi:hypothetical protein